MFYSTEVYKIKPVIPAVPLCITIFDNSAIKKISLDMKLLLSHEFKESVYFYLQFDSEFKKKFDLYIRKIQMFIMDFARNNMTRGIDDYGLQSNLDELKKLNHLNFDKEMRYSGQLINCKKQLLKWAKVTFKQRKNRIRKLYRKNQYLEMYEFLNQTNNFLLSLAKKSIQETNSLTQYKKIGKFLDWFLLCITDCNYHKNDEFKKLFQANIILKNDFIEVASAFTVLTKIMDYSLLGNLQLEDFLNKYLALFENIFISGNEIVTIYNLLDKQEEALSLTNISESEKERIKEIVSMHELTFKRKIR